MAVKFAKRSKWGTGGCEESRIWYKEECLFKVVKDGEEDKERCEIL